VKILEKVRETIERFEMLFPGETVIVGVSGGADSVGLLYILTELKEYNLKLIVSHVNHGIRAEEGKRDAEFVEQIATKLNLPFELKNVDAIGFKKTSGLSLEEAARVLRYEFFKEVLKRYKAQKIATGHTLDDQAETIIMRFIRGSGALGLAGIPPVSEGYIVRPLIEIKKVEIKAYLQEKGIDWVEDSSNRLMDFTRNRIRHKLIPQLEKFNPRIKETVARSGDIIRAQEEFIRTEAQEQFPRVFQSTEEQELVGTIRTYKSLPEALRFALIRIAIEKVKGNLRQVSYKHILSIDRLLASEVPSGEIFLPQDVIIAKGYALFVVSKKPLLKQEFSYTIHSPGKWKFPLVEVEVEFTEISLSELPKDRFIGFFDAGLTEFPIEVRSFRPGDRFIPLGMKKFKKVKRFFIDEKVPRFLRRRIPIFTSKGEIMWIGGMRIDERFKLRGKRALEIKIIKPRW
jgi:tRNA(Ile)-lysidine synthase